MEMNRRGPEFAEQYKTDDDQINKMHVHSRF